MNMSKTLMAVTLATTMISTVPAFAQEKMIIGYADGPQSGVAKALLLPWIEGINTLSNGELEAQFHGGGSVVNFTTALSGLEGGLVDGTMVATLFYRKELPINTLLVDAGATLPNRLAATAALLEMVMYDCVECREELRQWNAIPVISYVGPSYNLACRDAITSQEDMKSKRVRAVGLVSRVVEEMGATPVNVAYGEMYESLQRGVIDCALVEAVFLREASLDEVVKYYMTVETTMNVVPTYISIRADWYNGLSESNKAAVIQSLPKAVANEIFQKEADNVEVLANAPDSVVVVDAPEWANEAVARAFDRIRVEAIETAVNSGVADAQGIADRFVALYDKWEADFADRTFTQPEFETFLAETFYANYKPE